MSAWYNTNSVTRRDFLITTAAAAGLAWGPAPVWPAPAFGRLPDFVIFLTDDQRWDLLSCAGHPVLRTPNIDQLAQEGVQFPHAFVTTPICCTSRASILTGLYARTHGVHDFATDFEPEIFGLSWPALLRQAGYHVVTFGKYGIAHGTPPPEAMGFVPLPAGEHPFFRPWQGRSVHVTQIVTDQAVDWIRNAPAERPVCLMVHFDAPHAHDYATRPYPPEPDLEALYTDADFPDPPLSSCDFFESLPGFLQNSESRRRWGTRFSCREQYVENMRDLCRMITGIDRVVGAVRDALRTTGRDDRAVILFTSDNGAFYGERGFSDKWYAYEPSIRVPMIWRDPAAPPPARGITAGATALNLDIAPTLIERAGLPVPEQIQGRSLMPFLRGTPPASWREDWYFEHLFRHPRIPRSVGVRADDRWTYIRWIDFEKPIEELYNRETDPHQARNLADDPAFREPLEQMRARCDALRAEIPASPRTEY